MRIQILSDLHLECDEDAGEAFALSLPVQGDVLVLAGDVLPVLDLARTQRALGWFCSHFADVVYVCGNHEFYHSAPSEVAARLKLCAQALPNLHVLNPGVTSIAGVRFIGATLWFPFAEDNALYAPYMNDFRTIDDFEPWVYQAHAEQALFLKQHLRPGDVVVTHHLPHPRSVAKCYQQSPLNRFFLADGVAPLVKDGGAKLWVHGHTHIACDYTVGATRVVCNPRGYPGENAQPVDRGFTVQL